MQAQVAAPSKTALAKATGIALAVALLLLFAAVFPAEYGIDPLRTGALLGLTGIAQSTEVKGARATPAPGAAGIYRPESRSYKVESDDFLLMPGDTVEMKYHLQQGAGMVYAWKADGKLAFEFHGEPDQKPKKDYFESYLLEKNGRDSFYGTFTAPTTGLHGWFWENKGKTEVRFHLTTAGFYDSAKMFAGGPPEDMNIEDAK